METRRYAWRPRIVTDNDLYGLDCLKNGGSPPRGGLENKLVVGNVDNIDDRMRRIDDNESIPISVEVKYENSMFASLWFHIVQEPRSGLYTIELTHKDGDEKKDLCLDRIIHFPRGKGKHRLTNCLDLKKLQIEGFIVTDGSRRYLTVRVHVHLLRMEVGPGNYLEKQGQAYMLACYGKQAMKALRDFCSERLKSLKAGLGPGWNILTKQERSDLEKLCDPVCKSGILQRIGKLFEDNTWILYPLTMQFLHVGAECVNTYAPHCKEEHNLALLTTLNVKEATLCLTGNLAKTVGDVPKLKGYQDWASDTSFNDKPINTEFLSQLIISGWCAIQLSTVDYYFSMVSMLLPTPEKKKEAKGKQTVSEPLDDWMPDSDEDEMPMTNVDESPGSSSRQAKKLQLRDIKCQKIVDGGVSWIRPTTPNVGIGRVDCDGAFSTGKSAGYGCVIRLVEDDKTIVVVAVAGGSEPISSTYHEIQGALCGWRKSVELDLKNIEVASDCTTTVLEIQKGFVRTRKIGKDKKNAVKFKSLINKIMKLDAELDSSVIFHMYRGANEVANLLAHCVTAPLCEEEYTQDDIDTLPHLREIKAFLDTDAAGDAYLPRGNLEEYDGEDGEA